MAEGQDSAPTMSPEQMAAYREEIVAELAELEESHEKLPSKYKADRIKRLRQRLHTGIETV